MAKGFSRTYRFATFTAALITFFLSLALFIYSYFIEAFNIWIIIGFSLLCFASSFFIIQSRVERFIYKRIKKIYDDVTLLEATDFSKGNITTDINTLKEDIARFAHDKKLEIETLNIRENYRKEFIGNVSHELKTPLFTVQGYILTLLEGAMDDKTTRKKYLKRASKGVDRLIFIVRDLDMISQLEIGDLQLNKEDFDIVKLVQNAFDLLEMKATKREVTLSFDIQYSTPIMVHADEKRILQVISNLIENSIKYSKQFGTTEVSIEHLIKNKVIIRVTDNGEGIESQHIPRIFERFYRVDKSGSRKEGGSGLGLSIVKHVIEAHDEKIYVESQNGIGSEFSFTLEKAK